MEADAVSAHQAMLKEIKIADIVVGQRHRRDMGDHTTSWPTQNPMSRRKRMTMAEALKKAMEKKEIAREVCGAHRRPVRACPSRQ